MKHLIGYLENQEREITDFFYAAYDQLNDQQRMDTAGSRFIGGGYKFIIKSAEFTLSLIVTIAVICTALVKAGIWLKKEGDQLADTVRSYMDVAKKWAERLDGNIDPKKLEESRSSVLSHKDMIKLIGICGALNKELRGGFSKSCIGHNSDDPFLKKNAAYKKILTLFSNTGFYTVEESKKFNELKFRSVKWKAMSSKRDSLKTKGWNNKSIEETITLTADLAKYIETGDLSKDLSQVIDMSFITKLKSARKEDVSPADIVSALRRKQVAEISKEYIKFTKRVFSNSETLFSTVYNKCLISDEPETKNKED